MPPILEKILTETWAWITSTRMQLIFGGFALFYARSHGWFDFDETTANYIRQAVIAAVVGISVRDIIQTPQSGGGQPPMVLRTP